MKPIGDEIAKVRELLKKVTPGPWHTEPLQDERTDGHILAPEDNPQKYVAWACPMPSIEKRKANRDYIAAVNPAFMQALLDEIDRLNKEADWLASMLPEQWKCEGKSRKPVPVRSAKEWREAAREAVK